MSRSVDVDALPRRPDGDTMEPMTVNGTLLLLT